MTVNYFRIAWRGLTNNPFFSTINIAGLSIGLSTVILIGMWMYDELSYNKYHQNYSRIAQVMRHSVVNGEISSQTSMSIPLRQELGNKYSADFEIVVLSLPTSEHILSLGGRKFSVKGKFMEAKAPEMLSLEMLSGTLDGLKNPSSILLSESVAESMFGETDPINRTILIDNKMEANVTGVYRDIPYNSQFNELKFIAPWELHLANNDWAKEAQETWGINSFEIFVQLIPSVRLAQASSKIKNIIRDNIDPKLAEVRRPEVFLFPMSQWHLYSEWENGVNKGGRIQFVWLFGIIGVFVLLLACINFMNLSTARSEKRAKEVGIRKVVGSARTQLVKQFFSESVLLTFFGFIISLLLVELSLPFFNELADKKMMLMWDSPKFWILGIVFTLLAGLLAGSYPALYLSSFQPINVLKGPFQLSRFSAIPRKVLVVLQFTVSTSLIIGTIVVYYQIQFAKDRPIGYNRDGLLIVPMTTPESHEHYQAIRNELLQSGAISHVAASQNPTTEVWDNRNGFNWSNKESNPEANFATMAVTHPYGKTVGWEFVTGRDFSPDFLSDISSSIVLNQAAAKFMGFEDPTEGTVTWGGENLIIIGVIEDMVMTSPYEPVKPTIFYLNYENANFINIRIRSDAELDVTLTAIEGIFKKYNPSTPFSYKFADEEFELKFASEKRIGQLASLFAGLTIFISCLGAFGLASFVAEQRTKEIGIRKILGASAFTLWKMLSKDFLVLVAISCIVAIPVSYYFLKQWLLTFEYRIGIAWWMFGLATAGALVITLLTVTFQAIKAVMVYPVKSLRAE